VLCYLRDVELSFRLSPNRSDSDLFCFVHIEKSAGTTLIHLLRKNFGRNHVDLIPLNRSSELASAADLQWALKLHPKAFSFAGHSIRPYAQLGQYRERVKFYTILRNPIQRYASDYLNDCRSRGYVGTFADWAKLPSQQNLQVKSLSQRESVSEAKEALERDFAFFDLVDNFDNFLLKLRDAFAPRDFDPRYEIKNQSNNKLPGNSGGKTHLLSNLEIDLAQRANAKDIELYEWATGFLKKQASAAFAPRDLFDQEATAPLKLYMNLAANRIYRNLVYKPSCGLLPTQIDVLPRYRQNAEAYSAILHESAFDDRVNPSSLS
jgi:Sulfotransferase family